MCFNCGEIGHIGRDCTKTRTHPRPSANAMSKECGAMGNDAQDAVMPYVECRIGQKLTIIRLDSLCTGMQGVVSPEDAKYYAQKYPKEVTIVRTTDRCQVANGNIIETTGNMITSVAFLDPYTGRTCKTKVDFTIMPGAGDLILGWDAWVKDDIIMDTKNRQVLFGHHGFAMPLLTKRAMKIKEEEAREALEILAMEGDKDATFGDDPTKMSSFLGFSLHTVAN
jgi:hypothetical protein